MPIETLTSEQAQGNLRRNRLSIWPDGRRMKGRIGDHTICEVTPSFTFSRDDTIFTTGSCFARNIERKLGELGFDLPMLGIEAPEEERVSDAKNEILNKYTTAAVLNELRWGLGLEQFPEAALIDMGDGVVHDPHLHPQVPPVPRDRALRRRREIHDVVATLPRCRIFIMTLGLVEAWFDEATKLYLNGPPPRSAMAAEPTRFRFERQSHADILGDLQAIHEILREKGHPDFRMLVTVSPVPFRATYTGHDAIVANTYSKSVLRAAAEEFVQRHDDVDYFPSYEMVTLSERSAAYCDDHIHVQPAMVSRIMELAVSRYMPGYELPAAEQDLAGFGSKPRQLLAAAVKLRAEGNYAIAAKLLETIHNNDGVANTDLAPGDFYLLLGTTLARAGRNAEAEPHLACAVSLKPDDVRPRFKLGLIAARLRRPYALYHLERAVEMEPGSAHYAWRLGAQYERLKRPDDALALYRRSLSIDPNFEQAKVAAERLTEMVALPV